MGEAKMIYSFDPLVLLDWFQFDSFGAYMQKLSNHNIWAKNLKMMISNTMNHMLFTSIIYDSYISQSYFIVL